MKKLLTLILIFFAFGSAAQVCLPNLHSIVFDSSSTTYVNFSLNNALNILDSITVEAWIMRTGAWGASSAKGTIVCKHGWSSGEGGYVLRAGGNGELSFNIAGDSSGVNVSWREVVSPPGTLQLNTWYHVAGTFDGANIKLYVNGVLSATAAFPGKIRTSSYLLKIGRLADITQPDIRPWNGKIDEVRIWHRALSQSEIAANTGHHINPLTANALVAYWRFNEGTGNTITDLGTGNNAGTLVSGTWTADVPFVGVPVTPTIGPVGQYLQSSSPVGNQWYYNNVLIPNATSDTLTPAQAGNYTVTVTDVYGCSATSAPYNVTSVGINDVAPGTLFSSVSFSENILRVNADADIIRQAELKIIGINGQEILFRPKGTMKAETDLGFLPAGSYLVNLTLNNAVNNRQIVIRK